MKTAVCPTPNKQFFETKGEAKAQLKSRAHYFKRTAAPKIYIYHCACGGFHFTRSPRLPIERKATSTLAHESAFKKVLRQP